MTAPMKVMIVSSSEGEEFALAVGDILKSRRPGEDFKLFSVTHWRDLFPQNYGYLERLSQVIREFDFAVCVGSADDRLDARGRLSLAVRDNVLLEFGMSLGELGRDRAYLLVSDTYEVQLPSDLQGVSVHTWSGDDADNPRTAVRSIALQLRRDFIQKGRRPTAAPLELLDRDEVNQHLSSVELRLAAARNEVLVSGNDCKFVVESASSALEKALKDFSSLRVKVLCVDPDRAGVAEMLSLIDPRFEDPQDFTDSMVSVSRKLLSLRQRYPEQLEARLLPVLPGVGFFMVDPNEGGVMIVELYTAKPWTSSRAHLVVPPGDIRWRNHFVQAWNNYWTISRPIEP